MRNQDANSPHLWSICLAWIGFGALSLLPADSVSGQEHVLHRFERQQLSDVYFSEGANAGLINDDQFLDVVCGPYWYAGPDFETRFEIDTPVAQNREAYADNFFSWVHDLNGDGFGEVLVVGFPGTPAFVYENPGAGQLDQHWRKHQVFDWVSNESPHFIDLIGDSTPELVCTRDGYFGFATINPEAPFEPWEFHPITERITAPRFGHGLGVGDVNGDGLNDILHPGGWLEQPADEATQKRWRAHPVKFSSAYGGAEMHVYDVDGDGDNDVITSEAAHEFGLAWYEQKRLDGQVTFERHLIMGAVESENKFGLVFSELHSVAMADIDGDGLQDIVTGKTYYSHHKQSPMWDAGAVVYWFKLNRAETGIEWIPYQADGETGIGRQLSIHDLNQDGLMDFVVGGMKGAHVLIHQATSVSKSEWEAAQPKPYKAQPGPKAEDALPIRGPGSPLDAITERVPDAVEAEELDVEVSAGKAEPQGMEGFTAGRWSGNSQLWWTGARPGAEMSVVLPEMQGTIDLELALTCARDYAIVQLTLDDKPLGPPIDCFNDGVISTGVLRYSDIELNSKRPELKFRIVGRHPQAVAAFMVGLDFIRWKSSSDRFREPADHHLPKSRDGKILNLDFETGDLADWTATGTAFRGQPISGDTVVTRRSDMQSRHRGEYWLGGFEIVQDAGVGTLTSEAFIVEHPFASFLANGGKQTETRIELVRSDSGKVIYRVAGTNSESLRPVIVDLTEHLGEEVQVRLVDESRGGWGHLNFDHFRLHAKRPAQPTPTTQLLVADEYPFAGIDAQQAADAMRVPDGFKVLVGAAEPEVKQPIAMALDERGRVWVAEAYEYPVRASGDKGRDRILIFEDTDGDGSLDHRKVFAEGFNLISGLEVGLGGVWVGAAPYLLFIPDRDHDDQPDGEPQILLDGWGFQDTHETLNAFTWGPDGWLYGCHGVFTHSKVGKPGTAEAERVPINAGVWRYHPTRHEFEVFAHGTSNPWGVDFNDHGQAFVTACVIPHLFHIIPNARYQRQAGQHFNPYTFRDIGTIADHLHYLGATPHSGNSKSDEAGGGHAHAGAMIYLGGRWPARYRNQLFMNNIHGQRLNVDILKPSGSGYVGSHAPDFLLTDDQASQILNLRYGPDGNAWMIDWYDMQACHRREVEVHDRSNGRIYKIVAGELGPEELELVERVQTKSLHDFTDLELSELMLHQNEWFVRHARKVLQERAASGAISSDALKRLNEIATVHPDPTRVLRAMWTLNSINELTRELASTQLNHADSNVRAWTIRLAMESIQDHSSDWLLDQIRRLSSEDGSPIVRLQIASSLQEMPLEQRWEMLESLCLNSSDAQDRNLPLMYWYAAEPLAEVDAERALAWAMLAGERIPLLRELMLRRIGSGNEGAALTTLLSALENADSSEEQLMFLRAIRASLRGQRQVSATDGWVDIFPRLIQSESAEVQLEATALGVVFGDPSAMAKMRAQVLNPATSPANRSLSLSSLLDAKDADLAPTLQQLVKDPDLGSLAIRGLAQYSDPDTPRVLLASYPDLSQQDKRAALATLCSRVDDAKSLLEAIKLGEIDGTELTADLVRQLQFLKDDELNRMINQVWGTTRETAEEKKALIAKYRALVSAKLDVPADPALGRSVFAKTCMRCHVLYGVGTKVGPDLTGSNRADLDYLLSNIVDPSSVMAKEYQPTVIITLDGRVITGLVKEETERALTLQTADGPVLVPVDEIDDRTVSDKSMMPDDQLKPFSDHEIRSLFSYLASRQQVPIRATKENSSQFFNGKDLNGWAGKAKLWRVEAGELIGFTQTGVDRNEWLISDFEVGDFRLTLDVKLVGNQGNSGIQFRSLAEADSVSGYQADVGVGWWGKLYEEHGRALLWDKPGDEFVKPGEWNRYVIEAVGDQVRTYLNDQLCVDLDDPDGQRRGIIALQLHSGGPTEVRFRNFKLEVLDDADRN